ncbi:MAG: class I SAM-dependent methyltransferase [Myxococcales bacterium]|nr:class I SAM-dependent methyltransferase [Myxococcales bacterium]
MRHVQSAEGVIVGNVDDKYDTRNPIARRLVDGFLRAVGDLYADARPRTVLEVGCGEGRLADHLLGRHRPARFAACDLVDARGPGCDPAIEFTAASIYALPYADREFDMVICCEVLEHLERPAAGLAELARVADHHVLLSTPWEPTWRLLNLLRGRYLRDLGNTPGHLQHFTRRQLVRLAGGALEIEAVRRPLPWTVILGGPKRR